ncbi:MAG: CPBP family intramembrane metalloprotease [Puniceicoccales bacterium]|nr:CPBP family intramembrane metalloprotease [Puniceicoccales bacterium]
MCKNSPLGLLVIAYSCTLCITTLLTPLIFNLVVYWNQCAPCFLTNYLHHKGLAIFFERIRLLTFLLFTPYLWKIYRRQVPEKSFYSFDFKIFGQFFATGCFVVGVILGIKMLALDFVWTYPRHFQGLENLLPLKFLLCALALSLIEEWLFRGLIFKIFLKHMHPFLAIIFSSFVFTYFHFRSNYAINLNHEFATLSDGFRCLYEVVCHAFVNVVYLKFLIIFVFGCLLAAIYCYIPTLLSCVGLHTGVVFTLMMSREYLLFPITHPWLGSDHFLDSPLALLFMIVLIVLLHLRYSRLLRL